MLATWGVSGCCKHSGDFKLSRKISCVIGKAALLLFKNARWDLQVLLWTFCRNAGASASFPKKTPYGQAGVKTQPGKWTEIQQPPHCLIPSPSPGGKVVISSPTAHPGLRLWLWGAWGRGKEGAALAESAGLGWHPSGTAR